MPNTATTAYPAAWPLGVPAHMLHPVPTHPNTWRPQVPGACPTSLSGRHHMRNSQACTLCGVYSMAFAAWLAAGGAAPLPPNNPPTCQCWRTPCTGTLAPCGCCCTGCPCPHCCTCGAGGACAPTGPVCGNCTWVGTCANTGNCTHTAPCPTCASTAGACAVCGWCYVCTMCAGCHAGNPMCPQCNSTQCPGTGGPACQATAANAW